MCLWDAGHAITSHGAGFYDWQLRSFDPGSEDRMGLVDYIMRGIESTCHDRGFCNVSSSLKTNSTVATFSHAHKAHAITGLLSCEMLSSLDSSIAMFAERFKRKANMDNRIMRGVEGICHNRAFEFFSNLHSTVAVLSRAYKAHAVTNP